MTKAELEALLERTEADMRRRAAELYIGLARQVIYILRESPECAALSGIKFADGPHPDLEYTELKVLPVSLLPESPKVPEPDAVKDKT